MKTETKVILTREDLEILTKASEILKAYDFASCSAGGHLYTANDLASLGEFYRYNDNGIHNGKKFENLFADDVKRFIIFDRGASND